MEENKNIPKKSNPWKIISIVFIVIFAGLVMSVFTFPLGMWGHMGFWGFGGSMMGEHEMSIDQHRVEVIDHKEHIQGELIAQGDYACCLEKPCTYCIEKTPGHGEGAKCSCLEDVVEGRHPCGECIGEILEGHGSEYLSKYFGKSIAEEVGEEHIDTLREIIKEKYDIPVAEQL